MGSHRASVGKLPTPTISVTNRSATTVSLSWSLPRSYSKVSQYIVERGTDGTSFPNTVYTGLALSTGDNVTPVSGQTLYYRVRYLTTEGKYSDYSRNASNTVYAPVISNGAPTSITIQSSGGSYNWAQWVTDVDSNEILRYTLPSKFHPNISINELTGVMDVPGSLTGQSGSVTVQVTDKYGLVDTHTCTVSISVAPPVTGKKWNPGHYMMLQREADHLTFADRKLCYDHPSFKDNPKIIGAQYAFSWREMCPTTPGDFSAGIALIQQEVNYLKAMNKRFIFRLFDSVYEGSIGYYTRAFPDWLYNAGKIFIADAPNNYVINWKRWDSQALTWYLDIFRAVATAFDNEPYFEQVMPFEESSYLPYLGGVNYTTQSEQALYTIADTLNTIFSKTYVCLPLNWSPDPYNNNLEKFCEHCASIGIGFGNVDCQPNNFNHAATGGMPADFVMRGELNTNGGSFCLRGVDFQGPPCIVPISYNLESTGAYRNTEPTWDFTGQQVYNWINGTVKATHMSWCRNTYAGRDDQRWFNAGTTNPGGIQLAIINNPVLSNTSSPINNTQSPLFTSDFESGVLKNYDADPTPPYSGWAANGNMPVIGTNYRRSGSYSMKSYNNSQTSPVKGRTEVVTRWGAVNPALTGYLKMGMENWMGFSTYLPTSGEAGATWNQMSVGWSQIWNTHCTGTWAQNTNGTMMGMFINATGPSWAVDAWGSGAKVQNLGALDRNQWVDWVVRLVVNNQPINTGTNVAGNSARGRMTIWKGTAASPLNYATPIYNNDGPWQNENPAYDMAFFKMGFYSSWYDTPADRTADLAAGLSDRVVYHDDFRFWTGPLTPVVSGFDIVRPR